MEVTFDDTSVFKERRKENTYMVNLGKIQNDKDIFFAFVVDDSILWHRRLGHASMTQIAKLSKKDLVKGLLKIIR